MLRRKLFSILLTTAMLLSLCTSALALPTADETDFLVTQFLDTGYDRYETLTGGTWIEDFEGFGEPGTTYNADSKWTSNLYTYGGSQITHEVVAGKNGGKALMLTSTSGANGGGTGFSTKYGGTALSGTTDEHKALQESFGQVFVTDFKIGGTLSTVPTTEVMILGVLGGHTEGVIGVKATAANGPYKLTDTGYGVGTKQLTKDTWYRLIMKKWPTHTTGNYQLKVWVVDQDGNEMYTRNSVSRVWDQSYRSVIPFRMRNNSAGITITLDNSQVTYYWSHKLAPEIAVVSDMATVDVPVSTNSVEITSDQPLTTTSMKLTGGVSDIDCTVIRENKFTADNKLCYTVSWNEVLTEDTTYTLAYSLLKNTSALGGSGSFSFTTKAKTIEDSLVIDNDFEDAMMFKTDSTGIPGAYYDTWAYGSSNAPASTTGLSIGMWWNNSYDGSAYAGGGYKSYGYGIYTQSEQGYNNSKALLINRASRKADDGVTDLNILPASILTDKTYSVADGKKIVATWRMNVLNESPTGNLIYIGASTEKTSNGTPNTTYARCVMRISDNTCFTDNREDQIKSYTYREGSWYNLTLVAEAGKQSIIVTDAETGEVVFTNSTNVGMTTGTDVGITFIAVTQEGRKNEDSNILLDDIKVYHIDPDVSCNKLTVIGSQADSAGATITFNQPVLFKENKALLFEGSECNTSLYKVPVITYPDFNKASVSYKSLLPGEYTLAYGGVTSAAGLGMTDPTATQSFTVANDQSQPASVASEVLCTGLTQGSTVIFDLYSRDGGSGILFTGVYGNTGRLLGVEQQPVTMTADAEQPISVTFSKAYPAADYMKLLLWNNTNLQPIMGCYRLQAPKTELNVLMIGNSLTQDTQRYFSEMAAAGSGVTLNMTAKTSGGAVLKNHELNMKAELDSTAFQPTVRADYGTYRNGVGISNDNKLTTGDYGILNMQYDVIALQEFSTNVAYDEVTGEQLPETYAGYGEDGYNALLYLLETLHTYQPNAKIVLFQTWPYTNNSGGNRISAYNNGLKDVLARWAASAPKAVHDITPTNEAMGVVPVGDAFMLAERMDDKWSALSPSNDASITLEGASTEETLALSTGLYRDYNHASVYGCYLSDCVWYEYLTGQPVPSSYEVPRPTGYGETVPSVIISEAEHTQRLAELRAIAHQAIMESK